MTLFHIRFISRPFYFSFQLPGFRFFFSPFLAKSPHKRFISPPPCLSPVPFDLITATCCRLPAVVSERPASTNAESLGQKIKTPQLVKDDRCSKSSGLVRRLPELLFLRRWREYAFILWRRWGSEMQETESREKKKRVYVAQHKGRATTGSDSSLNCFINNQRWSR